MVTIYTTHCPNCKRLTDRLKSKNIEFEEVDDVDLMLSLGIRSVPQMKLEDNTLLSFVDAMSWAKNYNLGET